MKRYKKENPLSYTLGAALTFELLKHHKELVTAVYIHPQFSEGQAKDELIALCKKERINLSQSEKAFNILSPKEKCFVIGEFKKFDTPLQKEGNHVVLVNPSNAGNLGTILRSCLGLPWLWLQGYRHHPPCGGYFRSQNRSRVDGSAVWRALCLF